MDDKDRTLKALEDMKESMAYAVRRRATADVVTLEAQVLDLRAQLERVERWVPVTERLPESDSEVLVYVPDAKYNKIDMDCWRMQTESPVPWSTSQIEIGEMWDNHEFDDVTHWMPLPALPSTAQTEQQKG